MVSSCGGAQENQDKVATEEAEIVEESQSSVKDTTGDGEIDIINKMKKRLEGTEYELSEEQLAIADSLLGEVKIGLDMPKEELKKSLKEYRDLLYKEVLNEKQREVFREKGLEPPK